MISLPVLISTHELFIKFSLLCLAVERSEWMLWWVPDIWPRSTHNLLNGKWRRLCSDIHSLLSPAALLQVLPPHTPSISYPKSAISIADEISLGQWWVHLGISRPHGMWGKLLAASHRNQPCTLLLLQNTAMQTQYIITPKVWAEMERELLQYVYSPGRAAFIHFYCDSEL